MFNLGICSKTIGIQMVIDMTYDQVFLRKLVTDKQFRETLAHLKELVQNEKCAENQCSLAGCV